MKTLSKQRIKQIQKEEAERLAIEEAKKEKPIENIKIVDRRNIDLIQSEFLEILENSQKFFSKHGQKEIDAIKEELTISTCMSDIIETLKKFQNVDLDTGFRAVVTNSDEYVNGAYFYQQLAGNVIKYDNIINLYNKNEFINTKITQYFRKNKDAMYTYRYKLGDNETATESIRIDKCRHLQNLDEGMLIFLDNGYNKELWMPYEK